jgi:cytochrome P450
VHLKTHEIVAQAATIIVGGHDTTSFTMTCALFFLSVHPEAQAKLLAEVDAFGRDRKLTPADVPAFPYLDVSVAFGLTEQ